MLIKGRIGAKAAGSKKAGSAKRAAAASAKAATSAPIEAMQLLGRWSRIAQGHIAFGMGCSCGADFGNLHAKDMEQHILDYLDSKYRSAGSQAVCRLMAERAGYQPAQSGSITDLLRAIATQADKSVSQDEQLAMLADLGRSIESLDQVMKGGAV